jgi:O-antigen ligase
MDPTQSSPQHLVVGRWATGLTATTPRTDLSTVLLALAVAFVGFSAALPPSGRTLLGYPIALWVALIAAALGWLRRPWLPKGYVGVALFLAAWAIASSMAISKYISFYRASFFVLWLVIVIPGMASLLRRRALRNALLFGFATGVGIFVVVAALRIVRGVSLFDTNIADTQFLLGVNRNQVNARVVVLAPFLLAAVGPRLLVRVRWPLLGLCVLWLLYSGGRSGVLGAALVVAVFVVVQPRLNQTLRNVYVVLVGLLAVLMLVSEVGGAATGSLDRLVTTVQGERSSGDELRSVMLRKAGHLGSQNPIFGVGYGMFAATEDPVILEEATARQQSQLSRFASHNVFAGLMAETGFPGLIGFIALLLLLMASVLRFRADREAGALVCVLAGFVFLMFFEALLEPAFYCMIAFLIGAVAERQSIGSNDQTSESDSGSSASVSALRRLSGQAGRGRRPL